MARGRPLLKSRHPRDNYHLQSVPPQNAEYIPDWSTLKSGQNVYIAESDGSQFRGLVDAVTADGNVICYIPDGAGGKLFTRFDGYRAFGGRWQVPSFPL